MNTLYYNYCNIIINIIIIIISAFHVCTVSRRIIIIFHVDFSPKSSLWTIEHNFSLPIDNNFHGLPLNKSSEWKALSELTKALNELTEAPSEPTVKLRG